MRLPDTLLTELKLHANERDVPYQSLLKVYVADRITTERRRRRHLAGPNTFPLGVFKTGESLG